LPLRGIEMAAIATQQRSQLGHGQQRCIAIFDEIFGQIPQMKEGFVLQVMHGNVLHPLPAEPKNLM
jgi:hypothetical protein